MLPCLRCCACVCGCVSARPCAAGCLLARMIIMREDARAVSSAALWVNVAPKPHHTFVATTTLLNSEPKGLKGNNCSFVRSVLRHLH